MNKQTDNQNGNVSPDNETEKISEHLKEKYGEHIPASLAKSANAANEFSVASPWQSDVDTLNVAALRMRQSGKTTLARQLESIAANLSKGGVPQHVVIKTDEKGETIVTTQDLSDVPKYVPTNGEIDKFKWALLAGQNILLTGPTGCGKTHFVRYMAKTEKRSLIEVQGGAGATFERLIGQDTLEAPNGATEMGWKNAIIPLAMDTENCILYFDEPNSVPQDVLFYLHPAMDDRKTITFADGRVLKAKPGFVVVGAMNEGYSGTSILNAAFRSRFESTIECDYLPQRREATLLRNRCGASKELADKLTKLAKNLREQARVNKQLKTPVGTRSLMAAANLVRVGAPEIDAANMAILGQVPAQYSVEKKAISDAITAYFGQTAPVQDEAATEEVA